MCNNKLGKCESYVDVYFPYRILRYFKTFRHTLDTDLVSLIIKLYTNEGTHG